MTKPTDLNAETKPSADVVIAELVNVETILLNDKHKPAACRVVDGRELIDDLQTENESLRARVAELEDIEPITGEWQDAIRNTLVDTCRAIGCESPDSIDGGGSDGDAKSFTMAEICIGLNKVTERFADLESQLTQLRREIEAMRDERDELVKRVKIMKLVESENEEVGRLISYLVNATSDGGIVELWLDEGMYRYSNDSADIATEDVTLLETLRKAAKGGE